MARYITITLRTYKRLSGYSRDTKYRLRRGILEILKAETTTEWLYDKVVYDKED